MRNYLKCMLIFCCFSNSIKQISSEGAQGEVAQDDPTQENVKREGEIAKSSRKIRRNYSRNLQRNIYWQNSYSLFW